MGGKYIMMEDDLAFGGGPLMQYTDDVSQKCTLETCITLLTNITPVHSIKILKI